MQMLDNIPTNNMKLIVDTLAATGIPVQTTDIKEDLTRPLIHVQQIDNQMALYNRGTELEMRANYMITVFCDRKYITIVNAQMAMLELFGEKIINNDMVLYPSDLQFKLYPDDGVLEFSFNTYNYHTIGTGTPESVVEKMQQLLYNENINERTEG